SSSARTTRSERRPRQSERRYRDSERQAGRQGAGGQGWEEEARRQAGGEEAGGVGEARSSLQPKRRGIHHGELP
ncbi:hypothetical protein DIPPA_25034, partial [Diplonema papillatum]